MGSETTAQELRLQLLHGWFISCLLHGLMLVSLLTFFRLSPIPALNEPFHWDIALVQSMQRHEEPAPATKDAAQPVAKAEAPRPTTATRTNQTAVADTHIGSVQPMMEKALQADDTQPETRSSAVQAVPPTESIVTDPAPTVPQTTNIAMQHPGPSPSPTTQEPPASATVDTSSSTVNEPTADPVQPTQPSAMASTQMDSASQSRADYSWLQQMIFRRLEELKRSSRPSLDQSRPIKVMVKAVVSREGTLLDSSVAKSSGLEHIDQEAMALVQRAFPMQLDRTLDRQQIVMRIPITYSQE